MRTFVLKGHNSRIIVSRHTTTLRCCLGGQTMTQSMMTMSSSPLRCCCCNCFRSRLPSSSIDFCQGDTEADQCHIGLVKHMQWPRRLTKTAGHFPTPIYWQRCNCVSYLWKRWRMQMFYRRSVSPSSSSAADMKLPAINRIIPPPPMRIYLFFLFPFERTLYGIRISCPGNSSK